MEWEGDRLFCFLQQSKPETCGSPDKLSRVGELDTTPVDHSGIWTAQNSISLLCVCVWTVWTTVHLPSFRLCHPWLPPSPPPVDLYTHTHTRGSHLLWTAEGQSSSYRLLLAGCSRE